MRRVRNHEEMLSAREDARKAAKITAASAYELIGIHHQHHHPQQHSIVSPSQYCRTYDHDLEHDNGHIHESNSQWQEVLDHHADHHPCGQFATPRNGYGFVYSRNRKRATHVRQAVERGSSNGTREVSDAIVTNIETLPSTRGDPDTVYHHPTSWKGFSGNGTTHAHVDTNKKNNAHVNTQTKIKRRNRFWRKKKTPRSVLTHIPEDLDAATVITETKKATQEAWMCAYCGATFCSRQHASNHELQCIRHMYISTRRRRRTYIPNQNPASNATASATAAKPEHHDDIHNGTLTNDATPNRPWRPRSNGGVTHHPHNDIPMAGLVVVSPLMKMCMLMTDESLFKVLQRSRTLFIPPSQRQAEMELSWKARDREYYNLASNLSREQMTKRAPLQQQQSERMGLLKRIQNKLSDAYVLIKEGDIHEQEKVDQYDVRRWYYGSNDIKHDGDTLYINISVKNSFRMINNGLDQWARERWAREDKEDRNHFDRVRRFAHANAVRFAKLALRHDVKPEKVAVKLSNDLYRLFPIQLRHVGAEINTHIEYRKGAFFILSVNVLSVDWIILMKHFHKVAQKRKQEWAQCETASDGPSKFSLAALALSWQLTIFEISTIQRFIITAVTDDFFQYVEKKGMEMDLEVVSAKHQAAFMLEALTQMRKDEHDLDQKMIGGEGGDDDEEVTRGALLGPAIDADSGEIGDIPESLELPANLETICLEIDLPVGYLRLRKSLLHNSKFVSEAILSDALKYTEIDHEAWDIHDGDIGLENAKDGVDEQSFVGAKKKYQYLMPKSTFVHANMAFEEIELIAYNNFHFTILKTIRNPDVPYGRTFSTLSQITIHNEGRNSCRMVCSCEAKFYNGPPMVARQIKSAMRAGTAEVSVLTGEMICKYAEIFE